MLLDIWLIRDGFIAFLNYISVSWPGEILVNHFHLQMKSVNMKFALCCTLLLCLFGASFPQLAGSFHDVSESQWNEVLPKLRTTFEHLSGKYGDDDFDVIFKRIVEAKSQVVHTLWNESWNCPKAQRQRSSHVRRKNLAKFERRFRWSRSEMRTQGQSLQLQKVIGTSMMTTDNLGII